MFSEPPRTNEDLMLWRVFVASCEAEVWQYVNRWIKRFGNPYVIPKEETYEEYALRQLYQMALTVTFRNR